MRSSLINPGPQKEGQGLMLAFKIIIKLAINNFDVMDLNS